MASLEELDCKDVAEEVKALWGDTPWIIDVDTGSMPFTDKKYIEHRHWLRTILGEENDKSRGIVGDWRFSSVTIDGITRLGFKTEYAMNRFKKAFPDDIVE
jgi:hypothetical protein